MIHAAPAAVPGQPDGPLTPAFLDKLIYYAIHHAKYYMLKAGLTAEARRVFWLDLAESELVFPVEKQVDILPDSC